MKQLLIICAVWLIAAHVSASPAAKDTVKLKTVQGQVLDFDGDGQLDTLYMTEQRRERDGKVVAARGIPGFIAWGDSTAKKSSDTTAFDLPKETDVVVGIRVADLTDDKIVDIEILYRWMETTNNVKSPQEKIWLIAGGADLRDEKTVKLSDAKKSLTVASTVLSEKTAGTRDAEQPLGIGGYAIRRIRPTADNKPKRRADAATEPVAETASLEIYPNPARDVVHVRVLGASTNTSNSFELLDLNGRVVIKQSALPASDETDLDVRSIVNGTYRIRLIGCEVCPTSVQFQIAR